MTKSMVGKLFSCSGPRPWQSLLFLHKIDTTLRLFLGGEKNGIEPARAEMAGAGEFYSEGDQTGRVEFFLVFLTNIQKASQIVNEKLMKGKITKMKCTTDFETPLLLFAAILYDIVQTIRNDDKTEH